MLALGFGAAGYWAAEMRLASLRRLPVLALPPEPGKVETLLAVQDSLSAETSPIRFGDLAAELGIDAVYHDGARGEFQIFETTGGGVAVVDFDNDGRMDLYFANGAEYPVDSHDTTYTCQLYRQVDGDMFVNVTAASGAGMVVYGQGAIAADFDNDGFEDLLVTSFGAIKVLRNQGDGTFVDVSEQSGIASDRWSTSAAFADLDQDGDMDLYVCTYAQVNWKDAILCRHLERLIHCHPQRFAPQPDLFFRNQGDGTFIECSQQVGIDDRTGRGLGLAIADLTGDGLPDIYVANDTSEAFLFVNGPGMLFTESALEMGVALNGEGSSMAGMGVACADYDNNGWLDLFVTDYYEEKNALFEHTGAGGFVDTSGQTGLAVPSRDKLGWGTHFVDFDLDGRDDLFVANGHVSDFGDRPYAMTQQIYRQTEPRKFADVSATAGLYFQQPMHGRGTAWLDVNNDGLPDIVVSHIRQQAALLVNQTVEHGRWLGLELVGRLSARDGRNTRVTVSAGSNTRVFETVAGTGYLSSSDRRLLVGFGNADSIDNLQIHWPSGIQVAIPQPELERYHLVVEPASGGG